MENKSWATLDEVRIESMAVDREAALSNIANVIALGLPELNWLPEFGKFKGAEPIAIVGSGPSLRHTLAELSGFRTIMVAGSAHDFLVSKGVKPTYCAVVDPTPVQTVSYLSMPQPTCNYLIASQCSRDVFERLRFFPITVWHCAGSLNGIDVLGDVVPKNRVRVEAGGTTVGLRAIALANMLGYYEQHLFGFDGCLEGNETHAFALNNPDIEFKDGNGAEVLEIKIGATAETGRTFRIPTYLVGQAWDFEKMLKNSKGAVNFTVHGDGVFAEMVRLYRLRMG